MRLIRTRLSGAPDNADVESRRDACHMPLPVVESLYSARLTIRAVRDTDVDDLFAINGDPEVTRYLPYEAWRSVADGMAWIQRMRDLDAAGTGRQFMLELNEGRKVVGTLLLCRYDESSGCADLGFALGREYWRRGLMHEALTLFCTHAFEHINLRRLEAEVDPANHASNALLLRLGFTLEGTLRADDVSNEPSHETNVFGLLRNEWRATP